MKKLTQYFVRGLLFLAPVVATIYVIYIVFIKVDGIFKFDVPGFGFVVTLVFITMIGFIASNFLTRKLLEVVDHLFRRLPLAKMIYTAVNDLISAFVGDKKGFDRPVKVLVSKESGIHVVGFITNEGLASLGLGDLVSVYLPQSYNFAGNLLMVPRENVIPIEANSGDLMTFIVSGGISVKQT